MSASLHLELFERPRFRDQVELVFDQTGVECGYRDQSCRVDFHDQPQARRLIELLAAGGLTRSELEHQCPGLDGQVNDLLTALDALGLLTETSLPAPGDVISGRQMYREVRRVADRLYDRMVQESFYLAMTDGRITASQLIGYALEYYHLVRAAPRLIAPALSKELPGRAGGILQDFLASELHHDRMLESALAAVGIGAQQLPLAQPLPMTFGLCAALGAYSAQNPLTFMALLYLFEEPSGEFNEAFAAACARAELPEGFSRPILAHARLNESGGHGDISAELLAEIPAVGPEERHTVLKHVAITVETMALQERELLAYYGSPQARVPRVFD